MLCDVNEIIQRDLFPTEMYEIIFDDEIIDASRLELDKFKSLGIPSGTHNYYTSYTNPWRLTVGASTSMILDTITATVCRHTGRQYVIDNSWVNYVPKGCTHAMHRHGDDKFKSVVIYYDDIGETHFFDPRVQLYNEEPEKIKAKKGKCIIFPGWLMHEMPPHFDDDERVTIAMNLYEALK